MAGKHFSINGIFCTWCSNVNHNSWWRQIFNPQFSSGVHFVTFYVELNKSTRYFLFPIINFLDLNLSKILVYDVQCSMLPNMAMPSHSTAKDYSLNSSLPL